MRALAFTPDGRQLASGGADGLTRVRDAGTGTLTATLVSGADGWAADVPGSGYRSGGRLDGEFWYVRGLCRFEPGEAAAGAVQLIDDLSADAEAE